MKLEDIQDMLKGFGVDNLNLAVFLSTKFEQEWNTGFLSCGALMTDKPMSEVEKKLRELRALKEQ